MGKLLKALAAAALAFACSGQDSTELVDPPLLLPHSFGADYYDTNRAIPEGLDELPPASRQTTFIHPTEEQIQKEAKRLGITDIAKKKAENLGKLQQSLIAANGHGLDADTDLGCFVGQTDHCIYPDDPSLVVRTCFPSGVHEDYTNSIIAGLALFEANLIDELESYSEFSVVFDHGNCNNPQDPGIMFVRIGTTQGGSTNFAHQDSGTFFLWPWQSVFYFNNNTITIDLNKIIAYALDEGKSGTQMMTFITNTAFHEAMHGVGIAHDDTPQVGLPNGPYFMRAVNSLLWDYIGAVQSSELFMLNNYQR